MPRPARQVAASRKDRDPLRSSFFTLQEWLSLNARPVLTIGAIAVGLALLVGLVYYFTEYRKTRALVAFSEAYAKYTATVGDADAASPNPSGNKVNYPDAQTKFKESAAAFEAVADDYSTYRDLGKYYAGLSYVELGDNKGAALLEELANGTSEVTNEARLALAEQHLKNERFDQAEGFYAKLVEDPKALPASFLQTRLGFVKERLGKPTEAATLYRQVVDADRMSPSGIEAEKGLQRVDPKQAASLPPKTPPQGAMPPGMPGLPGGMPGGMPAGMPGGMPAGGPGF